MIDHVQRFHGNRRLLNIGHAKPAKQPRLIAEFGGRGRGRGGRDRGGRGGSRPKNFSPTDNTNITISKRDYTPAEWKSLSWDQQNQVRSLRGSATLTKPESRKRAAAALEQKEPATQTIRVEVAAAAAATPSGATTDGSSSALASEHGQARRGGRH